ncbi:hypothetical protein EBQ26_05795 [Allofranklinella schreckenbergeri]|uniref:Uncharacterized protein n=2 Tax=Comamonadaceae TaxID=80864 RepID=A0A2A2B0V2_9BURK|nr:MULTISPECIES: hypothetical protein [Comamonadaceae]PAT43766.1 hypothetical protein CK621_02680 [Vandammella animalimorsus]RMW98828.1 hypothetical protein EBQ26_05795 [Allofranklinella schreckenbergeri]
MRRFAYIVALVLCTVGTSLCWLHRVASLVGAGFLSVGWYGFFQAFAMPLPLPLLLALSLPWMLSTALSLVFLLLLWRRIALSARAGALLMPKAMLGWLGWLLVLLVACGVLGLVALGVALFLNTSGVPAGLLFMPLPYLLPLALFLIELLSLLPVRRPGQRFD